MSTSLRWFARALMGGLLAFAIYYPYKLATWYLSFTFGGPTAWQFHWMVDDNALVPLWGRLVQLGLWLPTIVATQIMIFLAIHLVWLIQRAVFFERRTVRALKWVGGSASVAGFFALVAIALDAWWVTAWNTELPRRSIHVHLDSGEMGVTLCGLGLLLLAFILDIAVLKQRENEEII